MSVQALQGIPRKSPGVTRIVICEEVFDYKIGGDQIAVLHPLSKLTFTVKAPPWAPNASSLAKANTGSNYTKAIKKAIWYRFTELRLKTGQAIPDL